MMYRLANLSLRNRALIALVTVFVLIFGVITTTQLRQELIPSLSLPTAVIYTTYPGASPQVVEDRVTSPVEAAVLGVNDVDSTSSSSSTGVSAVTVNFRYGTNMSVAQQDLQAAMSRLESVLPDTADYQVITGSLNDLPVTVLSVDDDNDDPAQLARRLNDLVVPELEKIDGVRDVTVSGAPVKQVAIKLDLDKLADNGLTVDAVRRLLQSSGALISGGTITTGSQTLSVTIGERLTSAADVRDLRLLVQPTGAGSTGGAGGAGGTDGVPPQQEAKTIRLGDVASVVDQYAPETSISRTNGKASLTLMVTKTPSGNTVAVSEAVNDKLADLADQLGDGATFTTVFDQAPFITQSVEDLITEGGLGLAMAIVVILIFLLSLRSTLVTAVSIPVSVLITMIGLRLSDYTLNMITLGALTISIGRVVDDAIVVIENIKRHLSYGEDKITAIKAAVREVATAITAATITTVAVFAPLGLVGGEVGELFRPFAVTVTVALLASLLVALTIVPVLAYWFLRTPEVTRTREEVEAAARQKEHKSWLQRGYVPILQWAIRTPVAVIIIAVLVLGGTVAGALSGAMKTDFLGATGQNTLTVSQKFDPGLSLDAQNAKAKVVEDTLRDIDGVDTVQLSLGSAGAEGVAFGFGGSGDSATYSITTDPDEDQAAIEKDMRNALDKLTDVGDLTVTAGQGYGSSTVDVIITSPDEDRLSRANTIVLDAMKQIDNVTDVTTSLATSQPMIQVTVDREKAAKVGLSDAAIGQALQGILSPQKVGTVETSTTSEDIVLDLGLEPASLDELRDLKITTPTGSQVRLGDVAKVSKATVPVALSHTDGQRTVTISLTPTGDNLQAVNAAVTEKLDGLDLPDGVTTQLGGVSADQADAFRQLGLALLVAIAIVYVVMVATFKSLLQPLILMVSIPFAATGALLALLATGTPLGVPALIGLLMLVGIVVTNAIVLIDLVNKYREAGDSVDDALIDGSRQRLRPILMTALATIFALIPMSLGITGGGVFISKPLAVVVIGGLISSTVLTLVIVPTLYHLIEKGRERRRLAKQAAADAASDSAEVPPAGEPAGTDQAATAAMAGGAAEEAVPPGSTGESEESGTPEASDEAGLARPHAGWNHANGQAPDRAAAAVAASRTPDDAPERPVQVDRLRERAPAPDGTVSLPADAVSGLAAAAEGLAMAFRGLATHAGGPPTGNGVGPDEADVLPGETHRRALGGRATPRAEDPGDDADLGRPRHAR